MKSPLSRIHQNKTPTRRHYIKEWAESRNMKPVDVARDLNVEISQVTRWYAGQMPNASTQERIAAMFQIEPEALLRDPDYDWLTRFFADRDEQERAHIKKAMEFNWPVKKGGSSAS